MTDCHQSSFPAKHTNTSKKTMKFFVIKLGIFLTLSHIDNSQFDCVMKIFSMLSKIQTNTPKKP